MATRIREKAKVRRENADKRPRAIARFVRIAPSKCGIVADLIRGGHFFTLTQLYRLKNRI